MNWKERFKGLKDLARLEKETAASESKRQEEPWKEVEALNRKVLSQVEKVSKKFASTIGWEVSRDNLNLPDQSFPIFNFAEDTLAAKLQEFYERTSLLKTQRPTSEQRVDYQEIPGTLNIGWYYSENKNEFQMAKVAKEDRATHVYVIGATGTGETNFLELLIQQDIELSQRPGSPKRNRQYFAMLKPPPR